jgi:polysaccharide export outer membrane protein
MQNPMGTLMNSKRPLTAGFLLIAVALALPAQTTPAPGVKTDTASGAGENGSQTSADPGLAHSKTYVIGDDDMLDINVWKEPELSRSIPVRSDGKISIPLVGEIQAAGKTPLQLEADITSRLRNYITEPEVTVIVQQINSEKYNMMGEVNKPGSYPLTVTTTVVDAIATAGGFKDFARKKSIHILRQNPDGTQAQFIFNYEAFINGKNSQKNIRLQPGDTVVVK